MPKPRFFLINDTVKQNAIQAIRHATDDTVVTFTAKTRSLQQNALLWSLLGQIVKAQPPQYTETDCEGWKARFMQSLGWECKFENSIVDGKPFAVGFRTSKLGVKEMSALLELIFMFGAENGIEFKRPADYDGSWPIGKE